jgi:hypothetical protein
MPSWLIGVACIALMRVQRSWLPLGKGMGEVESEAPSPGGFLRRCLNGGTKQGSLRQSMLFSPCY